MARRKTETLTCPTCQTQGVLVWVIGIPLRAADKAIFTKTYTAKKNPLFTVTTTQSRDKWQGTITCNTCQTTLRETTKETT